MKKPEPYKILKCFNFLKMLDYMSEKYKLDKDDLWAELCEWMDQGKNDSYGVCNLDTEYAEGEVVKYLKLLKEEYPEEKELFFFISW